MEVAWSLAAAGLEAALIAPRKHVVLQGTSAALQLNPALPLSASRSIVPFLNQPPSSCSNGMCPMGHHSVKSSPAEHPGSHLGSWFGDLPTKPPICKSHVAFWLLFLVVSSESQMIPSSKLVLRPCRLLRSAHGLCRAEQRCYMSYPAITESGSWMLAL